MFAIAKVYQTNNRAYGKSSPTKKTFLKNAPNQRNGKKSEKLAIEATIKVYLLDEEKDWSNGADMWDGIEQAMFSIEDDRFFAGNFELHMNTMGWRIRKDHYQKWKEGVTLLKGVFKAPQEKYTPSLIVPEKQDVLTYSQLSKLDKWEKEVLFQDYQEYIDAQKKIEKIEIAKENSLSKVAKNPHYTENTIALQSTAVYLGTIFWKSESNTKKRIKK